MVSVVGKNIAIIPARGGSKRIPDKNIIDFQGRPMIAWTIEAARQSGLFDRILVSTDDENIANVARIHGAEVPFLRTEYADDYSPVSEATAAALQQAIDYWQEEYELAVQLMANCPLRSADDIKSAIDVFLNKGGEFQISCFKYGWMNPWWAVKLGADGHPERLFPDTAGKRSQDLPELYCPTGAIWVAKAEKLLEHKTYYGPGYIFEPLSWVSAVDIDDYDDLSFAKSVFQQVSAN